MEEELKTIETVDTSPFKHLVMTLGELPTSFVDSMTYYECLAWLVNFIQNTVIPTVNNNAEAVEELQTAFVTLKNFVDNYFDNLDVQEEINNKLDAMAEAGTLQDIIYDYLNSVAMFCYDTVADLKLAENLIAGSYVKTLGFRNINDGGGCIYKISDTGTANEKDIIACQNGLLAILVPDYANIYPEKFGAYGDGSHDDTTYIQYALDNFDTVKLYNKTYLAKGIKLVSNKTLIGDGENTKLIGDDTTDGLILYTDDNERIEYLRLENIYLEHYVIGMNAIRVRYSIFKNIKIHYCNLGARFAGITYVNKFYDCEFHNCTTDGFECGLTITHPVLNLTIEPDIATFDFYSCSFLLNGRHGISGWMRVFNFFGGYSENNATSGVHFVNTDSENRACKRVLFSGFDIEEQLIAYYFEGTGTNCMATYINIIGGQISLKSNSNNEIRASLYFKGKCSWVTLNNIVLETAHPIGYDNTNTYDLYCETAGSNTIMCRVNGGNPNDSVLATNFTNVRPNNIFNFSNDLPLTAVEDYYDLDSSKVILPSGKAFKITIPNMVFLGHVKITTTTSASFSGFAFGQKLVNYIQTGSTGLKASDANNVTDLNFSGDGNTFVVKNRTGSDVTISKIEINGKIGK